MVHCQYNKETTTATLALLHDTFSANYFKKSDKNGKNDKYDKMTKTFSWIIAYQHISLFCYRCTNIHNDHFF